MGVPSLLESLEVWVRGLEPWLVENGLEPSLTYGPPGRPKLSACFDLQTPTRTGRLILWETGEAVVERAEWTTDLLMVPQQLEIVAGADLERALESVVDWVRGAEGS